MDDVVLAAVVQDIERVDWADTLDDVRIGEQHASCRRYRRIAEAEVERPSPRWSELVAARRIAVLPGASR